MRVRKWWISDIHGYASGLKKLIRESDIDLENDLLFIGGDMIDRGPDSGEVIKYVYHLDKTFPNVRVQQGNHEQLLRHYLDGVISREMYLMNGGDQTLQSFRQTFEEEELHKHLRWLFALPMMNSDEEYLYLHAGFDPHIPLAEQTSEEVLWVREPFLEADSNEILHMTKGKKVVHGHTPSAEVIEDESRIRCDLGVFLPVGGRLALVNLTEKAYWGWKRRNGKVYFRSVQKKK